MSDHYYWTLDTNFSTPSIQQLPIRSYHSSEESDSGSHGGGGYRPSGENSGRGFIGGHNRPHSGPSFSVDGRLVVEDSPFFPPREATPAQYVSPASLHLRTDEVQYGGFDRNPYYYRQHVEEQWQGPSGSPPPYYEVNYAGNTVTAMPPSAFQQTSRFPDAGDYLRQQLNLPPNAPVSLWSVPEPSGGEKPNIPLPMLIKLAIYGSQKKRLTLQEIYAELCARFQWFRDHNTDAAWKNSIRHNLSLNKVFKNMQRPVTEPGKGSYWELDVSEGEGYKRPRKRLNKKGGAAAAGDDDEVSEDGSYSDNDHGDTEYRGGNRRRHSPYHQSQPRLHVNTDRAHESSPPTAGSSRGNSIPMIDPPASQRRTAAPSAYRQPGYGQDQFPIDPALQVAGPSSYVPVSQYPSSSGRALAGSRSATAPVDCKSPRPEGRTLRPRPLLSSVGMQSSSSGLSLSPTDEAYAKSRRRAAGRT